MERIVDQQGNFVANATPILRGMSMETLSGILRNFNVPQDAMPLKMSTIKQWVNLGGPHVREHQGLPRFQASLRNCSYVCSQMLRVFRELSFRRCIQQLTPPAMVPVGTVALEAGLPQSLFDALNIPRWRADHVRQLMEDPWVRDHMRGILSAFIPIFRADLESMSESLQVLTQCGMCGVSVIAKLPVVAPLARVTLRMFSQYLDSHCEL
jgi:hypothetical protein